MKLTLKCCLLALSLCPSALLASDVDTELLKLNFEARFDYQRVYNDGTTVKDNTGFEGKYFMIRLDGVITPGLSYSWRQRLNKSHFDSNFFDATDWLYLNWDVDRWSFSGGKQIVAIGGWEYDRPPFDLYSTSVFWNNVPCYQLGASVAYNFKSGDRLLAQITESLFATPDNRDMYAYNLMWTGHHGFFHPIYSLNLVERTPGHFISYIALGNKFNVGRCSLELDYMNRASRGQTYLFKDCSVMAELSYRPTSRWNVYGKFTYDVNHSGTSADALVLNGTELKMAGVGVEFMPLVRKIGALRLHANCFYSWGRNANSADVMQNKTTVFDIGVKWQMNVFSLSRK